MQFNGRQVLDVTRVPRLSPLPLLCIDVSGCQGYKNRFSNIQNSVAAMFSKESHLKSRRNMSCSCFPDSKPSHKHLGRPCFGSHN